MWFCQTSVPSVWFVGGRPSFWGPLLPRNKGKTHRFTWAGKDLHGTQKRRKKGGCLCFEEAQDSYWLEAKNPQRDNSCGQREREWIRIKVQKPKPAGREGGASSKDGDCTSSASKEQNLWERPDDGKTCELSVWTSSLWPLPFHQHNASKRFFCL